ncbi:MAG: pyridoxal phosphate-dependent aminotransferase [Deltaproteobacteria bacterium]|nr:pyridoxal phosphate-dependent aminotransferase [Deltaproteobacteria bacterium]
MSQALRHVDPMGIYDTLFRFRNATNLYMGDPGTNPWSQGFPLTTKLEQGAIIPSDLNFNSKDLLYPKPWGEMQLREAIAAHYQDTYGATITAENVMVFPGGRPGLNAVMQLCDKKYTWLVEETEYTPYYDMFEFHNCKYSIVQSNEENNFRPSIKDYEAAAPNKEVMLLRSNPLNPTGVTWSGKELQDAVNFALEHGGLFDEAYELFVDPEPESALRFVKDINNTNIFVVGAATKWLQVPGARLGWIICSKRNVEIFGNYATFALGGVSKLSQLLATKLLDRERMKQVKLGVPAHYNLQRKRYDELLSSLGVHVATGNGGFYSWGKLPGKMTADQFNEKLFKHNAAILPGRLCDMLRREEKSPLAQWFRLSFGCLEQNSFEKDAEILKSVLA